LRLYKPLYFVGPIPPPAVSTVNCRGAILSSGEMAAAESRAMPQLTDSQMTRAAA